MFKSATEKLQTDFDLASSNLKVFLAQIKRRSEMHGWETLFQIPEDPTVEDPSAEDLHHVIDSYGTVTLEQVRAHAETYIATETRMAQESYQLYNCIMASLTKEALNKILLLQDEYYIEMDDEPKIPSGVALLRVIIKESIIDTNATKRSIREQLSKLDQYAIKVNGDVEKLNQHAKDLLDSLSSFGATTHDTILNLFKAYETIEDKNFAHYIRVKKDEFDEGKDIEPQKLMKLAENKFKMLVEDGKWQEPDKQSERIIALEAQLKQLKGSKGKSETKSEGNESKKNKGKDNKKNPSDRPAWRSIAPKAGESGKKMVKGDPKPWYWCPKHAAWVRHTPQECKGTGFSPKSNKSSQESTDKAKETLSVSKALTAIMEADEENE